MIFGNSRRFSSLAQVLSKSTPKEFIRAIYPSIQSNNLQEYKFHEDIVDKRFQEICVFSNPFELMNLTSFSKQMEIGSEDLFNKFLISTKKHVIRGEASPELVSKTLNSFPISLNGTNEEDIRIIFNFLIESVTEISSRSVPDYLLSLAKCKGLTLEASGEVWDYLLTIFIKSKNEYNPENFLIGLEGIINFEKKVGILYEKAIESYFWDHYLTMEKTIFMEYLKFFGFLKIGSNVFWGFCEDLYFNLLSKGSLENLENLNFMLAMSSAHKGSENFWSKAQSNIDDLVEGRAEELDCEKKITLLISLCQVEYVSNEFLENLIFDISLDKVRKIDGNSIAKLMFYMSPYVGERAPSYIWELLKTTLIEKMKSIDPLMLLKVYDCSKEQNLLGQDLSLALNKTLQTQYSV